MSKALFEEAIFERSGGHFGPLELISPIHGWPMITQLAHQMWAKRLVLMAEAAHVMPPIGAQGLNTSIADIRTLLSLVERGKALGSDSLGRVYHQRRFADVSFRLSGVSALNHASQAQAPWFQSLRRQGIQAIHDVSFIRLTLMQLGLGSRVNGNAHENSATSPY